MTHAEWISIEDRLPEDGRDYLVTDGDACIVATYKNKIKEWKFFGVKHWNTDEVTHWMPLPSPPPNN